MGSTIFAVGHFVTDNLRPLSQPASTAKESINSQLEIQEKGYELVLQREPQNLVALEGLVQTRLQMKNFQGAQKPLGQLIKLNPSRPGYQALAEQVQQKIGERKQ
ncbi:MULTISPECIES: tetratricopeptide repeat protein [Trichocoleus]|uniref:Tetratricopeptide repeat protein n=1 Tax=Trichocoleus desertorum GB2-A4 TaxID=2933944 RepID=A0ABV0JFH8_9CYAN|nr:tetratricopeptide repeat protein [Trichocoleus sp. FACHB-46]MBD1861231.1 tetratricopeptide repeat protein [Trichocoleus sp. FACHB-46]